MGQNGLGRFVVSGNLQRVEAERLNRERGKPVGYGGVAQLGEHLPCKQGVDSSILFISTSGCTAGKTR